jgi:anti-sigma factor RsiW
MADLQRVVAGLRCIDVLDRLSDYLDGDLSQGEREQVEAHLRGCDQCERFGGQMASIVRSLRRTLREPDPLDRGVAERLRERLEHELGGP